MTPSQLPQTHHITHVGRIIDALIGDWFAAKPKLGKYPTYSHGAKLSIYRISPAMIETVEKQGITAFTSQLNPTGDIKIGFRSEGNIDITTNIKQRYITLSTEQNSSFTFYAEWKEGCMASPELS